MTDPPSDDETAEGGAPAEDETPTLGDLQFVGPATEATLSEASIDASTVIERSVSFMELVDVGVDPGVAARIRREYSLPWSDEPTRGARLQRRASHVRHLRDEERSWIDESWAMTREEAPASTPVSDGSGSTADTEKAWRERSHKSGSWPAEGPDAAPDPNGEEARGAQTAAHGPVAPIDPARFTVPELAEVLETVADPDALAAVLETERAGEGRTTAIDAIEARIRAIGADPEEVGTVGPGAGPDPLSGTASLSALFGVPTELGERVAAVRDDVLGVIDGGWTDGWADTPLDEIEAEDWNRISVALLSGLLVFSALSALVVALQPDVGLPMGAVPPLVVTAVAGAVALPLRWWGTPGSYELTLVTGVLGLLTVGLIAAGAAGTVDPATAMVMLPVHLVVALALVVTTYVSRGATQS